MKKLPLLCALCFVLCSLAYTSEDISNANNLGDQKIVTKQTDPKLYRLDDKILRQEVIGMALKIKGVTLPENYTCKKYFADAIKNDWVCRAVELAADNGIIAKNKTTNPGKYITRAEALAILIKASGLTAPSGATPPIFPYSDTDFSSWQSDLVLYAAGLGIITNPNIIPLPEGFKVVDNVKPIRFYPNREAARSETFDFANKLLGNTKSSLLDIGGHIIEVIDGDTIHFDTLKIRMIGLDAPEFSKSRFGYVECFGLEAKNYLINLLTNKNDIKIEQDKTQGELDMYGRTLAYVIVDDININNQMIKDGYAFEETYKKAYKYQSTHIASQKNAENKDLGLWSTTTCGGDRKKGTIDEKNVVKDIPTTNGSLGNNTGESTCGTKLYCTQMTTCEEAKYYLNQCGLTRLDSDGDGFPCESLCTQ